MRQCQTKVYTRSFSWFWTVYRYFSLIYISAVHSFGSMVMKKSVPCLFLHQIQFQDNNVGFFVFIHDPSMVN